MKCTDKERQSCDYEKMGCKGCHYSQEVSIKELEKSIVDNLADEQWKNWQEVLKYINELQNKCKDLDIQEKTSISVKKIEEKIEELDKDFIKGVNNKEDIEIFSRIAYAKRVLQQLIKENSEESYEDKRKF